MPKRLLLLSGLAILCAVVFHAVGWGFTAMFAWAPRYLPAGVEPQPGATSSYYVLRILEQVVVFAIPSFMFVSGFFIAFSAGRNRSTVEWQVVLTRVKTLIFPYVLWTVVVWALYALEGKRLAPAHYAEMLLTGSTYPAYYYVPLLIQLYLLSPVIVRLAKTRWKLLLVVTGLLQLYVHAGLTLPLYTNAAPPVWLAAIPKWFFPARLFWFSFGAVAFSQLATFKQFLERVKWLALASTLMLLVLGVVEWEWLQSLAGPAALATRETVLDAFYAGAFILTILAFGDLRASVAEPLNVLGARTYGIYLIHAPLMEYVSRGIYHLAPWFLGYPLLLVAGLTVLGLGVPLLMMTAVRRSPARPLYVYQFG